MAGRALAFADKEIIRLAREDFVPVAGDDWYQRRRQDAEGKFFRRVADQGPRKGEGGSTRQGVYCLTADGKLLAYRPGDVTPVYMRETLRQGLAEWKKLPPARRQPGAIHIEDARTLDRQYARQPPAGGLVVNVYTRILDQDAGGSCHRATCKTIGGDQAARDHLWLTGPEWRSLLPAHAHVGDRLPVPAAIAERILRFHLVDNTRGEPNCWQQQDVRSHSLTLVVEAAGPDRVRLRLEGSALLATDKLAAIAARGYDVRLLGYIGYDARRKAIDRFDLVAIGEHWGSGTYTAGARPGRTPLGVAFRLARGDTPADRIPPQAARDIDDYFGRGR